MPIRFGTHGTNHMNPSKVLIVDDDRELALVAQMRLAAAGYDTTAAFNGEHAMATLEHFQPDVVVLDVRMPLMDGLQTLVQLRNRRATRWTPVIMLSASIADKRAAQEAGARCFLSKPYDGKVLCQAIRSTLNGEAAWDRSR
jgi:CheY-like chemotaxis protein